MAEGITSDRDQRRARHATAIRVDGRDDGRTRRPSTTSTTTTTATDDDAADAVGRHPGAGARRRRQRRRDVRAVPGAAARRDRGRRDEVDYKVSSGLARPDFFDWPAHLRRQLPAVDPDIVVVTFGGNDAQGMALADGSFPAGGRPRRGTRTSGCRSTSGGPAR